MSRLALLAIALLPFVRACDLCNNGGGMTMTNGGGMSMTNQQQQMQQQMMAWQQQQQQQMMMQQQQIMNNWNQQKGWGGWSNKPQPPQPAATGCQGFSDVVILLDSSGSIGTDNFAKQLKFVSDVVGNFQLASRGRSGYQFSVLSYSFDVKEEFPLNRFTTQSQLKAAITGIQYDGKNTDTHKALDFARVNSFRSEKGGRYGAVKIVIVITDGRSNNPTETTRGAEELRKMGALVLAIGVGNDVDPNELRSITANASNVFQVENYDVLDTIIKMVERRTCDITIEQGGGVTGGAPAAFDWQTYLKWCAEQQIMVSERESTKKILEQMTKMQEEEKKVVQERENKAMAAIQMNMMKEKYEAAMKFEEHIGTLGVYMMELKHKHMFMVASEMIKFCPLGDYKDDVMSLMVHGDSKWEPGKEEHCNVEEMNKVDTTMDPSEVARAIANSPFETQLEYFFGGIKESVCESMKQYVDSLRLMVAQHSNLRNFGILA